MIAVGQQIVDRRNGERRRRLSGGNRDGRGDRGFRRIAAGEIHDEIARRRRVAPTPNTLNFSARAGSYRVLLLLSCCLCYTFHLGRYH